MALPKILIDSATGSDSLASGAGPSTALTGSAGISASDGLSITLDGSPDLSGVAVDGSHVIYFADATAGQRNFSKITAKANSGSPTASVTIADAVQASQVKSWAIGGKRASLSSATSLKLCDNNSTNGDAMPGWIMEFSSGHSETMSIGINFRRNGDTTNGPITVQGQAGAGTLPLLTNTDDGTLFIIRGEYWHIKNMELQNTNATKSICTALATINTNTIFHQLKIAHTTNKFYRGASLGSADGCSILECNIGYTIVQAINVANMISFNIISNYIHDTGANGIEIPNNPYYSSHIYGNIIARCTGCGISYDNGRTDAYPGCGIIQNTIDSCTSDGIRVVSTSVSNLLLLNNILSNNGGYGLNMFSGGLTDQYIRAKGTLITGNNTYLNTSGAYKSATAGYTYSTCPWAFGDSGINPSYTSASTGDFSLGSALKALGFPLGGTLRVGSTSLTYSYIDPGAAQRQEAGGGPVMATVRGGFIN